MKGSAESFCTSCEWHGDGAGLVGCPICGEPIAALDVGSGGTPELDADEEYPADVIQKLSEEEEF